MLRRTTAKTQMESVNYNSGEGTCSDESPPQDVDKTPRSSTSSDDKGYMSEERSSRVDDSSSNNSGSDESIDSPSGTRKVLDEEQSGDKSEDRLVTAVIAGGGNRGNIYSLYAKESPQKLKIVGVAEPRGFQRQKIQRMHELAENNVYKDWREMCKQKRLADFVIISLPDIQHKEAALEFAEKGYHILLEKPMAVSYSECTAILEACSKHGVMLSVCHVLRYTPHAQLIHTLIRERVIGDLVNIQICERVGFWHFAHSFVRGNWRNTAGSAPTLLTKCCHDLDLLLYWFQGQGLTCRQVSSFGSLKHFKRSNKPPGAASRCLDCSIESSCPYSANKIYIDRVKRGDVGFPVDIVSDKPDIEDVVTSVRDGPYGRCVYECDNDVVDNQVVNLTFDSNTTASFTMVAFTRGVGVREVKVFGTKGEITCDFETRSVHHYDFLSDKTTVYPCTPTEAAAHSRLVNHWGADYYTIDAFVRAVQKKDKSVILTGPDVTLRAHQVVFLAEEARKNNCVVDVPPADRESVPE